MSKVFLLADDDTDDAELFKEALSVADSSAIFYHARDGQEVLDMLEDSNLEDPNFIFLDINMPVLNGWECLSKLKSDKAYNNIPVIIYSTASHQREIDIAFNLGASCFFTKPKDFKELKVNLKVLVDNVDSNLSQTVGGLKGFKCNESRDYSG